MNPGDFPGFEGGALEINHENMKKILPPAALKGAKRREGLQIKRFNILRFCFFGFYLAFLGVLGGRKRF